MITAMEHPPKHRPPPLRWLLNHHMLVVKRSIPYVDWTLTRPLESSNKAYDLPTPLVTLTFHFPPTYTHTHLHSYPPTRIPTYSHPTTTYMHPTCTHRIPPPTRTPTYMHPTHTPNNPHDDLIYPLLIVSRLFAEHPGLVMELVDIMWDTDPKYRPSMLTVCDVLDDLFEKASDRTRPSDHFSILIYRYLRYDILLYLLTYTTHMHMMSTYPPVNSIINTY